MLTAFLVTTESYRKSNSARDIKFTFVNRVIIPSHFLTDNLIGSLIETSPLPPKQPVGDSEIFFLPYSFERKIIYLLNNFKGFSFFRLSHKLILRTGKSGSSRELAAI